MKQSTLKRSLFSLTLAAALGTVGAVTPALASGGNAGGVNAGGANAGGGGGGKVIGAPKAPETGVSVPLSNFGLAYNGKIPQGTVILGYAADGSAQSMTFSLTNINVPNGTVLPVQVLIGRLETIFTYYQISQVVYSEVDGTITINHNSATLVLNTLNGDVVPNFPGPVAAGTTEIRILAPDASRALLDGITGSFHA